MSKNKSCKDFIASYPSKIVNCMTCKHWNNEDFVCMESEEVKRRKEEIELDSIDRQMRGNKPIRGPL